MPFKDIKVIPADQALDNLKSRVQPTFVIDSLRNTLLNRSKPAVTALIEEGYLDRDYSYSHFMQRGRAFTPSSRRTMRVHFFSSHFTKRRLYKMTPDFQNLMNDVYLGYSVIRPGDPPTLGRTFIEPPEYINSQKVFFPAQASFESNICGAVLRKKACPYLSQDHVVLACATASLWISSTSLSLKGVGITNFTTGEITALALSLNRPYGPTIGERGLLIGEMEHALMAMGYDPILSEYPDSEFLLNSSYTYLESGIPPVAVIDFPANQIDSVTFEGLHALTIIGHVMDTGYRRRVKLYNHTISSSDFVPGIILHDDQNGMYLVANILPAGRTTNPLYKAKLEITVGNNTLTGYCKTAIFPLPSRVLLQGEIATSAAISWLQLFQTLNLLEDKQLVVRTFLVTSNKFKQSLIIRNVPLQLSAIYRGCSLPRFIWIVEYGYADDWIGKNLGDLKIQGEFIVDPTSPATKTPSFLIMHLPKMVLSRHVDKYDTIKIRSFDIPNDYPYSPLQDIDRP
ncbi:MAG: hypothetical protein JW845_09450 [Dehalococcoidales bacterium]|nr:hypothetical protein [Dehalococcoidales bacterium]